MSGTRARGVHLLPISAIATSPSFCCACWIFRRETLFAISRIATSPSVWVPQSPLSLYPHTGHGVPIGGVPGLTYPQRKQVQGVVSHPGSVHQGGPGCRGSRLMATPLHGLAPPSPRTGSVGKVPRAAPSPPGTRRTDRSGPGPGRSSPVAWGVSIACSSRSCPRPGSGVGASLSVMAPRCPGFPAQAAGSAGFLLCLRITPTPMAFGRSVTCQRGIPGQPRGIRTAHRML